MLQLDFFEGISIRGRYIYGYLCLLSAINATNSKMLPPEVDEILCEFVSSNRLDLWFDKAQRVLPPSLSPTFVIQTPIPSVSENVIHLVNLYYASLPEPIVKIIDELIWIGLSNLFVGYNSEASMEPLEHLIIVMEENMYSLPSLDIVRECSVSEDDGWGKETNMSDYVSKSSNW